MIDEYTRKCLAIRVGSSLKREYPITYVLITVVSLLKRL